MESDLARANAPTRAVMQVLLGHQRAGVYSLTLGAETRLSPGSLHPILARLERLGWVESWWQDAAAVVGDLAQRSAARRRWYRLTADGAELVRQAIRQGDQAHSSWIVPWRPLAGTA